GSKMRVEPGGLVYIAPDGERSDYLRSIKTGEVADGETVELNFLKTPKIVLSEVDMPMFVERYNVYSPAFSLTSVYVQGAVLEPGVYEVCVTSMYGRLEANPKYIDSVEIGTAG